MSDTAITLHFAGQDRPFDLNFENGITFEREMRKSLYDTFRSFLENRWHLRDAIEVVRLGLIGGGMDELEAFSLADGLKGKPASASAALATSILEAAFFGQTAAKAEVDRVFGASDGYGAVV